MTAAPEVITEPAAPPLEMRGRRRGIPGLRLFALTHGLQRATLVFGLALIASFLVIAVFAPLLAPYGFAQNSSDGVDFVRQGAPSAQHWFGTSVRGEDVLSRVLFGARTALYVIAVSLVLSLFVGVPLGLLSGYVGRWLDRVLVLFMDAMYAFPTLLLAIVVSIVVAGGNSSSLGGVLSAAVAITVIFVPQYFRVVRNATVSVKHEPYVDAARVSGASVGRILFRHILANVTSSLPVIITLNGAEAILTLAGLGFLGFGIEPTQAAEWGYDLNKALSDVSNGIWWTGVYPGVAIVLVVLGMTLVGESLNEVFNPLLRTRRGVDAEPDTAAAQVPDAPAVAVSATAPDAAEGDAAESAATAPGDSVADTTETDSTAVGSDSDAAESVPGTAAAEGPDAPAAEVPEVGQSGPGASEVGPTDPGAPEAGPSGAGASEVGPTDSGAPEAGPSGAGASEVGPTDPGAPEAGPTDPGAPEKGTPGTGALEAGTAKDRGASTPPGETTDSDEGKGTR